MTVQIETRYEGDDSRYPPPQVGDIRGWGDPHRARLVVAVRTVGPHRFAGGRDSDYSHWDGYEVDTILCPPDKLLHYLRTGEWFHLEYPGWKEAVEKCEQLIAECL